MDDTNSEELQRINSEDEKKKRKKQLEKRDSSFQDVDLINLCRLSYKGGADYVNAGMLFTHNRENQDDFLQRLRRAYFLNYTAPIVDTYSFFLFKSQVTRLFDENDLQLSAFINNCDNNGAGFDFFIKNRTIDLLVAGRTWIVVDSANYVPTSRLDELSEGCRPYVYTIPSEDVLDFEDDPFDNGFSWVKFKKRVVSKGSWDYSGDGYEDIYVIWSKYYYETYSMDGTLLMSIENPIGRVPIISKVFGNGNPFIRDIAFLNRSLFNWCSLLDELLYRQTFSWLVMPSDPNQALSEKKIGTSWAWTYDPQSKHKPSFISPDVSQAEIIMKQIERAVTEIYRMANLDWNMVETANKSGVAKAYDFMNVNKALSSLAVVLEDIEREVLRVASFYFERNELLADIVYPEDFSFIAVQDRLDQLYVALGTTFSGTFKKLVSKQIVDNVLPTALETDLQIISAEIEASGQVKSLLDKYADGSAATDSNEEEEDKDEA